MNVTSLLRFAPTLCMAAVMAYAAYSIEPPAQAVLHTLTSKPNPVKSGNDLPGTDALGESAIRKANENRPRGRNPFVAIKSKQIAKALLSHDVRVDPNLTLIKSLTLNATFIQGETRYASISGRLYRQGQHLDAVDNKASSLIITQITSAQVTLEANGNRYILAYPEEFTASSAPRSTTGALQLGGRARPAARPGRPSGRS